MKGFCMKMRVSYSGYYTCLPSTRYGFDSRYPLQDKTFRFFDRRIGGRRFAPPTIWLSKSRKVLSWCIYTTTLELILCETIERNQTKEVSPPPRTIEHGAEQKSFLFLLEEKNRRAK